MSPGETLGAMRLITSVVHSAKATALTPVKALQIGRAQLDALMAEQPEMAAALQPMASRLKASISSQVTSPETLGAEEVPLSLARLRAILNMVDA